MSPAPASAGDTISGRSQIIKVRVAELRQLFNAIDPSPFRERDLDPRAEEFIIEWAGDLPVTHTWLCWSNSSGPLGEQMKLQYLARRFASISRSESRVRNGNFAHCFGEVVSAW